MRSEPCPVCFGTRLKKEALGITIVGQSIIDVTQKSIKEALLWLRLLDNTLITSEREKTIAKPIIKELFSRLIFLNDVGLDYLTIDRAAATLAGGETQRIRLASQIGSGLSGVLYVLDEPSIGLHQRDNKRLIDTLTRLRDLGNTVIVIEHDRETMEKADWIVDFGPGAGENGGQIVAEGTPNQIKRNRNSETGKFLSGKRKIDPIETYLQNTKGELKIIGAAHHNLKHITVNFPLGKMICVTGVSGSGKSTLVHDILYQALAQKFYPQHKEKPGQFSGLVGEGNLDKVVLIDQSPIGRTPRSNPATYTGTFTFIRELFALTKEARVKGYKPGRFSFNVKGGRCEACQGEGQTKIEMQFLPPVYVNCEVCHGKRYNSEALEVNYRGKNIAEVLEMTVRDCLSFFTWPQLTVKLQTLDDVGLGYIRLGQPAPTLSGGEAQRVKLATELSRKATGKTLYILDEPTTGLHFADLEKLLFVLKRLVASGNTVIIIEHNLDVIKNADWIIDLGPEGGDKGGEVVAEGTPQEVAVVKNSYTGKFLKEILGHIK
jgi:excinuclease ABC subunit A